MDNFRSRKCILVYLLNKGNGLPPNRLEIPCGQRSKNRGKMRNSPVGLLKQIFQCIWGGDMLWSIAFSLWSIEKKFLRADACDFSKSSLQIWDFRSSDQKLQFLSWNLTFGSQFLGNALLTMYIIIWNIFRFLLQLIDPQSVASS